MENNVETNEIEKNAKSKLRRKKCDLIIANDISKNEVMGGDMNSVHIFNKSRCLAKYKTMKKVTLSKKILTEIIFTILYKKNDLVSSKDKIPTKVN